MIHFKTFRDLAISIALLIIPFFFLSAHLKDPSRVSWLDRVLLQAGAPIQVAMSWAAESVGGIFQEYLYLVDVRKDNERLLGDNQRLEEEIWSLRAKAQETHRLEELLNLSKRFEGAAIAARVVARDISPSFRVDRVVLDRGLQDRVSAGMPVISTQGLVGQVRRVAGRYTDVLLAIDVESRVDVIVQRTGARGRLEGIGERERYRCEVQFDRPEDEVAVGDELYTSGLDKKFPPSVLVGTVTQIDKQEYGLQQRGKVTPAVDFSRLEEVIIIVNQPDQASLARLP